VKRQAEQFEGWLEKKSPRAIWGWQSRYFM